MSWSTEQYVEPGRQPVWRRKAWWAVGAVAAIVLFIALFIFSGRNEVAKQIAAIRARGEPATLAELAAYYPAPPVGQDATALWLGAAQSLGPAAKAEPTKQLPFFGEVEHAPLVGQPWPEIDLARQFLQNNAAAMQQLHEAAALGGKARYPVDFLVGFNMSVDYAEKLRGAVRCLRLEANVRAHDGDMHGAAESLRTGFLLSQSLKDEPLLVSQLVRIATHTMVVTELQRIGPVNLPPADLARLQETLSQIDFNESLKRAMVGERALGLSVFENPAVNSVPVHLQYFVWIRRSQDELTYLYFLGDMIAVAELPWHERWDEMVAASDKFESRSNRWNILTNLLTPALGMFANAEARAETANRLALISVAIGRYSQQHSAAPNDLAALVPEFLTEIPVDPSDGNPFIYKAQENGYLLYSPSKLYPLASSAKPDAETGANPLLVFRWPPLPDEPRKVEDENAEPTEEVMEDVNNQPPADVKDE